MDKETIIGLAIGGLFAVFLFCLIFVQAVSFLAFVGILGVACVAFCWFAFGPRGRYSSDDN